MAKRSNGNHLDLGGRRGSRRCAPPVRRATVQLGEPSAEHRAPTGGAAPTPRQGKPTRVLLALNSVAIGGMEEHVRLIAASLDTERFEVDCVVPADPNLASFVVGLRAAATQVHEVTVDRRRGLRNEITEAVRLVRLLRRERYDVVHLHSTSFRGQVVPAVCARLAGVRRVLMTEHLPPERRQSRRFRLMRRTTDRLLTRLVCVSEFNRRQRAAQIGTPRGRTVVVANGIDVERFVRPTPERLRTVREELGIAEGAPIVGTAVRFEPDKGLVHLIDAFPKVLAMHPDAVLVLLGDGSLRAELEARCEQLGITASVRFPGFKTDPKPYVASMDVFVLPVPFGSASIALLEAMALGRPTIISFGGEGEPTEPGISGFWARPNDHESIAEHVNTVLGDTDLARAMSDAARRRVADHFSAARMAADLGRLYTGDD